MIEAIGVIHIRDVLARLAERWNFEIAVDPEGLTHRDLDVRLSCRSRSRRRLLNGWHFSRASWLMWEGRLADPLASAEIAGFQGRVGLVDDLQPLLGSLVAAMSIGVVLLDEDLIPRLEPHHGKRRLDVEHRERLVAGGGGACGGFRAVAVCPAIAAPPGIVVRLAV